MGSCWVYGMCGLDHFKFSSSKKKKTSSSFNSEVLHQFKIESEQLPVLFIMEKKTGENR